MARVRIRVGFLVGSCREIFFVLFGRFIIIVCKLLGASGNSCIFFSLLVILLLLGFVAIFIIDLIRYRISICVDNGLSNFGLKYRTKVNRLRSNRRGRPFSLFGLLFGA